MRDVLGLEPWEMEIEQVKSVRDNYRTLIAGCVSSGKTHGTAATILWFLIAFAPVARVFAMAPTERQLRINLWTELPRMWKQAKIPLGGESLDLKIRMDDGWYAMGFSPKDEMGVFGMHGEADLIIVDDAQGITPEIWGALENAMAGGTTRILASCNPVVTSGEVFDVLSHRIDGYNVLIVTADKNDPRIGTKGVFLAPNVRAGRVVVPGTITADMVTTWEKKFGYDSDFFRTKVRALLPKQEADTLIPLDWLEMASMREVPDEFYCTTCLSRIIGNEAKTLHHKDNEDHVIKRHYVLGNDVARFGDDKSVIVVRSGRRVLPLDPLDVMQGNDTMEVAGRVVVRMKDLAAMHVNVDVIGIGSGVADRVREQGYPVNDINVGELPTEESFSRLRDQIWWNARASLDPNSLEPMAIPRDNELIGDLAAPKWTTGSDGKIKVEGKDSMKKRIGRSPDLGDAACLAMWDPAQPGYA